VKVTVFGATGKIGALVVSRLLEDGHQVTAFVRSPGKLGVAAAAVDVVAAELTDADAIREAVEDADAVISALGPPIDPFVRGTPLTDGTRRIVAAMHECGVRRLVALATVSVPLAAPVAVGANLTDTTQVAPPASVPPQLPK